MKKKAILAILTLIFGTAKSQSLESDKCSWKTVELKTYENGLPDQYVVVGTITILLDRQVSLISELTEKEIKKIKKSGHMYKYCLTGTL